MFQTGTQLEWDVDTNESSDGLIYDYIYTFRDDSNLEILKKKNLTFLLTPYLYAFSLYENPSFIRCSVLWKVNVDISIFWVFNFHLPNLSHASMWSCICVLENFGTVSRAWYFRIKYFAKRMH
jgi:hypothetical protein